jgi:hypothetical protein
VPAANRPSVNSAASVGDVKVENSTARLATTRSSRVVAPMASK